MVVMDVAYTWQSGSDYQAFFTESALTTTFPSWVRCRIGTVASGVTSMAGQHIKGVDQFFGQLAALGTRTATRPGCADVAACDLTKLLQQQASSQVGSKYVALEHNVMDLELLLRCVCRSRRRSQRLRPIEHGRYSGAASQKASYTSACVYPDGTFKRKTRTWTLQQFVTYVSNFGLRINNTMTRLDTVAAETISGISVSAWIALPLNTRWAQ